MKGAAKRRCGVTLLPIQPYIYLSKYACCACCVSSLSVVYIIPNVVYLVKHKDEEHYKSL